MYRNDWAWFLDQFPYSMLSFKKLSCYPLYLKHYIKFYNFSNQFKSLLWYPLKPLKRSHTFFLKTVHLKYCMITNRDTYLKSIWPICQLPWFKALNYQKNVFYCWEQVFIFYFVDKFDRLVEIGPQSLHFDTHFKSELPGLFLVHQENSWPT
jgi:hypothetical protein